MRTPRRPMRPETEMFKTVCDTCHKPCEVPFRPNGKKPVFCDACFNKNRDVATSEYIQRKDKMVFDGPETKTQSTRVEYSPSVGTAQVSLPDAKFLELKREINSVNAKLDKLVDLVSKLSPKKVIKKEE